MITYQAAGVDLEKADSLIEDIAQSVVGTWTEDVIGRFGGFAAGVRLPSGLRRPVLLMSTDGVGTKLTLAARHERLEGIGFDLVAMCVDDLAAAGARPIAFTDYLAVEAIEPSRDQAIVASVARACAAAGCPLVGGETAEHPGVVPAGHVDLAGAALGVLEESQEITGARILPGDQVVGLSSPNLRSNGFSLVRAVLAKHGSESIPIEDLLAPSVIYAPAVLEAVAQVEIHGLAHITGGGLPGNLARILPEGSQALLEAGSWEVPAVFSTVQELGSVDSAEMFRTFNMGVGFCLVVPPDESEQTLELLSDHDPALIGEIVEGTGGVSLA